MKKINLDMLVEKLEDCQSIYNSTNDNETKRNAIAKILDLTLAIRVDLTLIQLHHQFLMDRTVVEHHYYET